VIVKRLLCPERVRRVPEQFSWVDHRLVRDKHICRCGAEALALYLLLVTVADAEGLSYYSERAVGQLLSMDEAGVQRGRSELIRAGLIAYEKPLYQVLSLDPRPGQPAAAARGNRCASLGEVLRAAIGGAA
jgi:hypothetical protein